jgi:hypothetical protein
MSLVLDEVSLISAHLGAADERERTRAMHGHNVLVMGRWSEMLDASNIEVCWSKAHQYRRIARVRYWRSEEMSYTTS